MNTRSTLRQSIRLKRNALSANVQKNAANTLQQRLSCHQKILSAQHIAIYLANDGELNPMPFIQWCWEQQKYVYLPVIHPFSKGNLLFLRFSANSQMVNNQYGIAEPKLTVKDIIPVQQLDVLFTPLVAFDHDGNRLGMGGGFYDRTLALWYKQSQLSNKNVKHITPYPIGLAHKCQKVEHIPHKHWDIPLPEIISV